MVLGASRLCLSTQNYPHRRQVATQSATPDEALEILKKQRAQRPTSPHIAIYEKQLTMLMSGAHRITGVALTGALYVFLYAYLGAPLIGMGFDSNSLAQAFGALPLVAKLPLKFLASFPFTYHSYNGLRHLIWDTAKELTLKGVYRTGYAVLGLSCATSLLFTFL